MHSLEGTNNLKGQQNLNAITKLHVTFKPPQAPASNMVTPVKHSPRVVFYDTVQLCNVWCKDWHTPGADTTQPVGVEFPLALIAPLQLQAVIEDSSTCNLNPSATNGSIVTFVTQEQSTLVALQQKQCCMPPLLIVARLPTPSLTWKPARHLNTTNYYATHDLKILGTSLPWTDLLPFQGGGRLCKRHKHHWVHS